ncbi:hypothetical protein E2C01_068895 [Portunus trituberculatus]|uniref:Uncharacterized protein n=1 Tax=Portunus trituberculatus TaxID=210409 RepID=A0A5B7HXG5_PORTR|nr:hypothetical protein [Portunus trituberculatus]
MNQEFAKPSALRDATTTGTGGPSDHHIGLKIGQISLPVCPNLSQTPPLSRDTSLFPSPAPQGNGCGGKDVRQ